MVTIPSTILETTLVFETRTQSYTYRPDAIRAELAADIAKVTSPVFALTITLKSYFLDDV
jgi:hypothetical protein